MKELSKTVSAPTQKELKSFALPHFLWILYWLFEFTVFVSKLAGLKNPNTSQISDLKETTETTRNIKNINQSKSNRISSKVVLLLLSTQPI